MAERGNKSIHVVELIFSTALHVSYLIIQLGPLSMMKIYRLNTILSQNFNKYNIEPALKVDG